MWICLVSVKASCIPFQSVDEAKNNHIHVILHKQTGEPYGGFCTCCFWYVGSIPTQGMEIKLLVLETIEQCISKYSYAVLYD